MKTASAAIPKGGPGILPQKDAKLQRRPLPMRTMTSPLCPLRSVTRFLIERLPALSAARAGIENSKTRNRPLPTTTKEGRSLIFNVAFAPSSLGPAGPASLSIPLGRTPQKRRRRRRRKGLYVRTMYERDRSVEKKRGLGGWGGGDFFLGAARGDKGSGLLAIERRAR